MYDAKQKNNLILVTKYIKMTNKTQKRAIIN